MDLNQLRQFVTIAETENLTRASELLFVSQPALTQTVKKLEDELGVTLFTRTKNRIMLNENGKAALRFARNITEEEDRMKEYFELNGDRALPSITFFSSQLSASRYFIPKFISEVPDIGVTARLVKQNELKSSLINALCDIAFSVSPMNDKRIYDIPFCKDDLFAYLHKDHPLYGRDRIRLKDLEGSTYLRPVNESVIIDRLDYVINKDNVKMTKIVLDDYQMFRSTLANSDYVVFVSSLAFAYYEDLPDRRYVRIDDDEVKLDIYLSYMRKNEKKAEPFLRWIRENYRELIR